MKPSKLPKTDLLETLKKLPEMCGARKPDDNAPIAIRRGIMGYSPWCAGISPEKFNELKGIKPVVVEAMIAGSMFGFHVPGADPDIYTPTQVAKIEARAKEYAV